MFALKCVIAFIVCSKSAISVCLSIHCLASWKISVQGEAQNVIITSGWQLGRVVLLRALVSHLVGSLLGLFYFRALVHELSN